MVLAIKNRIYYKFKHSLNFKQISFNGNTVISKQIKEKILPTKYIERRGLSKSKILLSDLHSGKEYKDMDTIEKNTYLIAKRVTVKSPIIFSDINLDDKENGDLFINNLTSRIHQKNIEEKEDVEKSLLEEIKEEVKKITEREERKKVLLPNFLICGICQDLIKDPQIIKCCGDSFCDICIRKKFCKMFNFCCPSCNKKIDNLSILIPNTSLEKTKNEYLNIKTKKKKTKKNNKNNSKKKKKNDKKSKNKVLFFNPKKKWGESNIINKNTKKVSLTGQKRKKDFYFEYPNNSKKRRFNNFY